jgi:hypothetical protein
MTDVGNNESSSQQQDVQQEKVDVGELRQWIRRRRDAKAETRRRLKSMKSHPSAVDEKEEGLMITPDALVSADVVFVKETSVVTLPAHDEALVVEAEEVVAVDEQPRRSGRERKTVVSIYDEATSKNKSAVSAVVNVVDDTSLLPSDDVGDESYIGEPPTKKPKPISNVFVPETNQSTKAVSSIDANNNKKKTFMGEVFTLYSDQKNATNGANLVQGFFDEIILTAKDNTSIRDIVLTGSDKLTIIKQYAKSVNKPSVAVSNAERSRLHNLRHPEYNRDYYAKRKAAGTTQGQKLAIAGLTCRQKLDIHGNRLQYKIYDFDPCYEGLKEFTKEYGHSNVPTDHHLYPFCCQVRASFHHKASGGKVSSWKTSGGVSTELHTYQYILLGLLNFVWSKPPNDWRNVTKSWEPEGKRPYVVRKKYTHDDLFPGEL